MQACTGIRQFHQQEPGVLLGPVYLETMMMQHLCELDILVQHKVVCYEGEEECRFEGTQRLELMKNEIEPSIYNHELYTKRDRYGRGRTCGGHTLVVGAVNLDVDIVAGPVGLEVGGEWDVPLLPEGPREQIASPGAETVGRVSVSD
ncbi:hypothetical protein ACFX2I_014055 [Malus domestica]